MSRKNRIAPFKAFDSVDLGASHISETIDISFLDNVGITLSWTGTSPVGEFIVDGANVSTNTNDVPEWVEFDFGNDIVISGNSGNHIINMNQVPFNKLRFRYERTGGTGTLNAILHVKQVGG